MTDAGASISRRPGWLRWLLRRSDANAAGPANRDLRLLETAALIVAGVLLAVATVNDIGRAVHITQRVKADQHTYRVYMHTRGGVATSIKKVDVTTAQRGKIDIACSPSPGGQLASSCLFISGPIRGRSPTWQRTVIGGFTLLPHRRNFYRARYGCFGNAAREQLCGARPRP